MAAIVLDHEHPDEQGGGEGDEQQTPPEMIARGDPGQGRDEAERRGGDGDLEEAARQARTTITGQTAGERTRFAIALGVGRMVD